MNTTPPASNPQNNQWSTQSKKQLLFSLILILASFAFEPIFAALGVGTAGSAFLAVVILSGVLVGVVGCMNP